MSAVQFAGSITGPINDTAAYLLGLYYMDQENTRGNGNPIIYLGANFLDALPISAIAQPGDYIAMNSVWQADTWAAFSQVTYSFTEEWLLTLGLRYTNEQKDADLVTTTFSSSASGMAGYSTWMRSIPRAI